MAYKIKNKLSRIRYCCKVNKFYTCNKITNLWSEYPEDSEKLNILSEIIIQMIEYSFYIIKEEKDYLLGRLVGNEKEGKEQRKNILTEFEKKEEFKDNENKLYKTCLYGSTKSIYKTTRSIIRLR